MFVRRIYLFTLNCGLAKRCFHKFVYFHEITQHPLTRSSEIKDKYKYTVEIIIILFYR